MPGTSNIRVRCGLRDRARSVFRCARHANQNHVGLFQSFDMLAVIVHHRIVQRVDTLEVFGNQGVLRTDAPVKAPR